MTGGKDNIAFWDTISWLPHNHYPGELAALASASDWLATAESSPNYWEPAGAVRLWNWRTGQFLGQLDQPGRTLALSADGRLLAVAGPNTGFTIWTTATRKLMRGDAEALYAHMEEELVAFARALKSPEARAAFEAFAGRRA